MRSTGLPELQVYDMLLGFAGTALWAVVGFMWRDRAIIMINVVASIMLLGGLLTKIVGGLDARQRYVVKSNFKVF